jgi:hypothetical protein
MRVTEQQTPGNDRDSTPDRRQPPDIGSSARKRTEQAKVPPGKTWLWFVLILLANFFLGKFLSPSPETQRSGDLQSGGHHHGPIHGSYQLSAGGRKGYGVQWRN